MDNTETDRDDGVVEGPPLLAEDEYIALYAGHSLVPNFHGFGDKLVINWRIIEGPCSNEIVCAYYNIEIIENGFKCRSASHWYRDILRLFPSRSRRDRLPPSLLGCHHIVIKIKTVTKGRNKRQLKDNELYSVVDEILRFAD